MQIIRGINANNEFLLRFFENLLLGENHILKNREMHILFVDPVNDPVKRNILQCLKENPKANYRELADKTGYSTSTIKRHIQELKKMEIIERIGSDKTGYWKTIE